MTYRKKPLEVEAIQWTGRNLRDVILFTESDQVSNYFLSNAIEIETLEGTMKAMPGDWIIRGIKGELYPCKPDIFAATYEPVEVEA